MVHFRFLATRSRNASPFWFLPEPSASTSCKPQENDLGSGMVTVDSDDRHIPSLCQKRACPSRTNNGVVLVYNLSEHFLAVHLHNNDHRLAF